ncbi:MAG: hypothetical protein IKL25_02710 [Clostridia bacterium]|nr:hypothetical protein [Clostridia bacterium]
MFLRKLVVIVLPLVMAALLCLVLPLVAGIPFWTEAIKGLALGLVLALLLPLCGAVKKREPFSGLLWVPLTFFIVAVISQYLAVIGIELPLLSMLKTGDSNVILVECAFIGFLVVQLIRTRK